ncbi:uncharacterized protein LOC133377464 [Rhineura floridana]|uniref:uncharacterized protein LOC133377464 n=1 Tax=Rhineura floridana TaxID=261503 RepID=UPI002AC7EAED|nr:uncharacterized protein LOC133377464 [Rhineura floridana]
MVLTRKKCKDLGIELSTDFDSLQTKGMQTKITHFYNIKETTKEVRQRKEVETTATKNYDINDWLLNNSLAWLLNAEDSTGPNLAQELITAAEENSSLNDSATQGRAANISAVSVSSSMPPLESSSIYGELKTNSLEFCHSQKETEHPVVNNQQGSVVDENWSQMVSQSLIQISKFVAESNSLLSILMDVISKQEYHHKEPIVNLPTTSQATQTTQLKSLSDISSKKSKSQEHKHHKKSKNIKSCKIRHKSHMRFDKLFKLLDTPIAPNKRKKRRKRKSKKTKLEKRANTSTSIQMEQNNIVADQEPLRLESNTLITLPISPNVKPPLQQKKVTLEDPELPKIPKIKSWELVLNKAKLAIINYPKPKGALTQFQRRQHFHSIMEHILPGIDWCIEVASIEYLFYNYVDARAILSFHDKKIAGLLYENRNLLLLQNLKCLRVFENIAPLQSLLSLNLNGLKSRSLKSNGEASDQAPLLASLEELPTNIIEKRRKTFGSFTWRSPAINHRESCKILHSRYSLQEKSGGKVCVLESMEAWKKLVSGSLTQFL